MSGRFTIYVDKDNDNLISVYDDESMSYTGLFDYENITEVDEIKGLLNELDTELKQKEKEIVNLKQYMGRDKYELMKENLKIRNMIKFQDGLHKLEINYFNEVLLDVIDEFPESQGLLYFKDLMDW